MNDLLFRDVKAVCVGEVRNDERCRAILSRARAVLDVMFDRCIEDEAALKAAMTAHFSGTYTAGGLSDQLLAHLNLVRSGAITDPIRVREILDQAKSAVETADRQRNDCEKFLQAAEEAYWQNRPTERGSVETEAPAHVESAPDRKHGTAVANDRAPTFSDRELLVGVMNAIGSLAKRLTGERMVMRICNHQGDYVAFDLDTANVTWRCACSGSGCEDRSPNSA
jgi:hypothetical protein